MHITETQLKMGSAYALESSSFQSTQLSVGGTVLSGNFDQMYQQQLRQQAAPQLEALPNASVVNGLQVDPSGKEALLTALLEMLLGKGGGIRQAPATGAATTATNVLSFRAAPAQTAQVQFVQVQHRSETESCQFEATGKICLADGSERQFDVGYALQRSEDSGSVVAGQANAFKDPLVLDFGNSQAALGTASVAFDLDSDGKAENMRLPAGNSGLLVYDRNHNGVADNGSELFGPQSGSGFSDLAKLDDDGNGWIDGSDKAFADLEVWRVDDQGKSSLESLTAAGVGALSVGSARTPFTIKDGGQAVAQVQASGVWVGEKTGAGVIRQVDVATTPIAAKTA